MKFNILRFIFASLTALVASFASYAFEGQWKLYPTFDVTVDKVIDSPDKVYMLALAQPFVKGVPESLTRQGFLFVYDKKADELAPYDASGALTQSVISHIDYNPKRGYLLIIYEDYNVDLLFDDGHVVNVPALKSANVSSSKEVNGVFFDPARNHAYLATDFGYAIIDDKKGEIYESRIYNTPLSAAGRVGDYLVLSDNEGQLLYAPAKDANFSLSDFTPIEFVEEKPGAVTTLLRVSDNKLGVISEAPEDSTDKLAYGLVSFAADDEGGLTTTYEQKTTGNFQRITEGQNGHYIWSNSKYGRVNSNGDYSSHSLLQDIRYSVVGSYDGKEFWEGKGRSGLRSFKKDTEWSLTRDFMLPDAPAVYISQDMVYHPTYGMLVSNRGNINYFLSDGYYFPILLSGLKDGRWVRYGLPYTNPDRLKMMYNPAGMAVDPRNPDYVYFGSWISGIGRINLRDPKDIFHMSSAVDYGASYPEFVEMLPVPELWSRSARMSPPKFDREGNLWSIFNNLDAPENSRTELWVWPRVNIDATKDAKTFRPWAKIPVKTTAMSNNSLVIPLSSNGNTNRVLVSLGSYQRGLVIVDHKGTLANTGDDVQVSADHLYDQDGQPVSYNYIRSIYEDPTTGLVWVGTDSGVFTVNPSNFMNNPSSVNRIKVARDDGTSLADYLLNGVDVSCIMNDPFGRKWFGTIGGGLVCTSSDGRVVKGEWTAEDSPLPDNNVYGLGWNEATGSLMISTGKGLVEFFPSGEGNGADFEDLRIYPNPVRPEYSGWVTIDGLTEGALVKITDARGNLIRELGRVEGGTIRWDAANLNGRRVPSGVYYIMASGGESDSSLATVGKVLVVN